MKVLPLILLFIANVLHAQVRDVDYYTQQALISSPLLGDLRGQAQSSRIDSARVRATYKPQVTGTSNNYYAPVINGYGYDEVITNGRQLSGLVGINQSLVGRRNLDAQFETLRLQHRGINNNAAVSEQEIRRTVVAQYITVYGDMQELTYTREVSEMLKKEDTLLKKLTESNVYRQTDYLTFVVTRQQQELATKQLSIQFSNDLATLNYLSGVKDTASATLAEPQLSVAKLPGPEGSVFFEKFVVDSLLLANSRELINFSYKPKVNLFADAGYNSSLALRPYKNFGTSVGINVTVPIYDGKQRKLQYAKIDIQEKTRQGYRDFFSNQYEQQIAQLSQQLKATIALIADINQQIRYSQGLIEVNARLLETGDARIADLVIAVNNYLTAKNLLVQNDVSRMQIINQINYWNR